MSTYNVSVLIVCGVIKLAIFFTHSSSKNVIFLMPMTKIHICNEEMNEIF